MIPPLNHHQRPSPLDFTGNHSTSASWWRQCRIIQRNTVTSIQAIGNSLTWRLQNNSRMLSRAAPPSMRRHVLTECQQCAYVCAPWKICNVLCCVAKFGLFLMCMLLINMICFATECHLVFFLVFFCSIVKSTYIDGHITNSGRKYLANGRGQ